MSNLYAKSGVDIKSGEKAVENIKSIVSNVKVDGVLSGIGSFGGLFEIDIKKYKRPVLVSSIDGVGTKLKLAFMSDRHHTIGQDLVNHCINDILVQGARPLFFMDYLGTGKLSQKTLKGIIEGISISCKKYNCALLGGETAEMPGFYADKEYDIAGSIVGIVDYPDLITGENIQRGDLLIGLPSSGLHTNGYSLARYIAFEQMKLKIDDPIDELNSTIGDALMQIHRCYLNELSSLIDEKLIHGMAHITGGGFKGNIKRILSNQVNASVDTKTWDPLPIFNFLQKNGQVSQKEMYEVFNMGIGMVLIISPENKNSVLNHIEGSVEIGKIYEGVGKVEISY